MLHRPKSATKSANKIERSYARVILGLIVLFVLYTIIAADFRVWCCMPLILLSMAWTLDEIRR
jgi:hypothetical protein